jgi:hypothetical protein
MSKSRLNPFGKKLKTEILHEHALLVETGFGIFGNSKKI